MLDLKTYFPHAKVGPDQRIYDLVKVGHGKYTRVEAQHISFTGDVAVKPIFSGSFEVNIEVVDDTNCTVGFPSPPIAGTYKAAGKKLEVNLPDDVSLTVYEGKGGTYIDGIPKVPGHPWIGE